MMRRTLEFLLLLLTVRAETHLKLCLSSLANHIQSDRTLYRAAMVQDAKHIPLDIDEIDKTIFSRLPGRLYGESVLEKIVTPKSRTNTLYLTATSSTSFTKYVFDRMHQETWYARRQKVIVVSNNVNPREILPYAWAKGFVDVTFLRPSLAILYEFNPFNNTFARFKCDSTTVWFPDKMKDLLGHKIPVDVLNDRPFCSIERNSTGHLVRGGGAEFDLFLLIAQKLNFQPQFLPRHDDNKYNQVSLVRDVESGELLTNIHAGKAEMVANARICPFLSPLELNHSCSGTLFYTYTCPIVPIIRIPRPINQHFFVAVGCIVIIILMDLLLAKFWHFDHRFWNFPVIVKLILGLTVLAQPRKRSEKIFYLTLIIISMTYLVDVFNVMISFNMGGYEEVPFTQLRDIFINRLVAEADYDVIPSKSEFGVGYNVIIKQWKSRSSCLEKVIYHKNVTCLLSEVIARLAVDERTKVYGHPVMKFLNDCPWFGKSQLILARGSPYLRPMNDLIDWLRAGGIPNWLLHLDVMEYKVTEDLHRYEDDDKELIEEGAKIDLWFWVTLGLGGLLVATIVFLAEILTERFRRCNYSRNIFYKPMLWRRHFGS